MVVVALKVPGANRTRKVTVGAVGLNSPTAEMRSGGSSGSDSGLSISGFVISAVTWTHAENSDVFPDGSVAVAMMYRPTVSASPLWPNSSLPFPSVHHVERGHQGFALAGRAARRVDS